MLTPGTVGDVVAVAELPDIVRGYEAIKVRNVERFRERADELLRALADGEAERPPLQVLPMAGGGEVRAARAGR
jgi:indolepyruvate ferredoxin oxidoreductase